MLSIPVRRPYCHSAQVITRVSPAEAVLDWLLLLSTIARTLCEGVLDVGSSPHGSHTSPAACTMPAILCGRAWSSDGLGSPCRQSTS